MASVLLMGPPGTGKTRACGTLLRGSPKIELVYFVTEPGGADTLRDILDDEELKRIHFKTILPGALSFSALSHIFQQVHNLTYDGMVNMKGGIDKKSFNQFLQVIEACNNFVSDDGVVIGNLSLLLPRYVIVFDSLSGLCQMMMNLVTGARDALAPGEWNVAQGGLTRFLQTVLAAREKSLVVVTAHVDREHSELTGQTILTAAAIGAKMGPKMGRMFGDVILARREKANFSWDTLATQSDTKFRLLPPGSDLTPDFAPILRKLKLEGEGPAVLPAPAEGTLTRPQSTVTTL